MRAASTGTNFSRASDALRRLRLYAIFLVTPLSMIALFLEGQSAWSLAFSLIGATVALTSAVAGMVYARRLSLTSKASPLAGVFRWLVVYAVLYFALAVFSGALSLEAAQRADLLRNGKAIPGTPDSIFCQGCFGKQWHALGLLAAVSEEMRDIYLPIPGLYAFQDGWLRLGQEGHPAGCMDTRATKFLPWCSWILSLIVMGFAFRFLSHVHSMVGKVEAVATVLAERKSGETPTSEADAAPPPTSRDSDAEQTSLLAIILGKGVGRRNRARDLKKPV